MDNLFYSQKEKILFWVAGYTDNSSNVKEIISMLESNAKKLADLVSANKNYVRTFVINESRRYKNMRVFYLKTHVFPVREEAFMLKEEQKMIKWLED